MNTKSTDAGAIDRIIAAARDEFTEHGFAGARVDAIARRAKVNKALLYYHIGGKAALYERVIHGTVGQTAEKLAAIVHAIPDPVVQLRTFIQVLAATLRDNPQIPSIIIQELVRGGDNLPDVVAEDFACMFDLITDIIEGGVQKGVFHEAAPVLVNFMVAGPFLFHRKVTALKARFDHLVPADRMAKNFDIALEADIEALVMRAVLKNDKGGAS